MRFFQARSSVPPPTAGPPLFPIAGLACVGLVLFVGLAPTADASVALRQAAYLFSNEETAIGFRNLTYAGFDAFQLRNRTDADQDGVVNETEAEAFEAGLQDYLARNPGAPRTSLNGRPPTSNAVDSLELEGLVGPVNSDGTVESVFTFRVGYPPPGEGETVFRRQLNQSDEGEWVLRAPTGRIVGAVNGLSDPRRSDGGRVVTGRASGNGTFDVRFVVPGSLSTDPSLPPGGSSSAGPSNEAGSSRPAAAGASEPAARSSHGPALSIFLLVLVVAVVARRR